MVHGLMSQYTDKPHAACPTVADGHVLPPAFGDRSQCLWEVLYSVAAFFMFAAKLNRTGFLRPNVAMHSPLQPLRRDTA